MVKAECMPPHRIILFLQQSSVEWCSSLWLHVLQEVDPHFSRTVMCSSKFDNRLKEFGERWEIDKYLASMLASTCRTALVAGAANVPGGLVIVSTAPICFHLCSLHRGTSPPRSSPFSLRYPRSAPQPPARTGGVPSRLWTLKCCNTCGNRLRAGLTRSASVGELASRICAGESAAGSWPFVPATRALPARHAHTLAVRPGFSKTSWRVDTGTQLRPCLCCFRTAVKKLRWSWWRRTRSCKMLGMWHRCVAQVGLQD